MKYIKKFESILSNYYHEYTIDDDFILNSEKIPCYSKSQSKLIDILKKGNLEFEIGDYFIVIYQGIFDHYICEYVDEWFSVEKVDRYDGSEKLYLCDQYDGLIKLLKDKEII